MDEDRVIYSSSQRLADEIIHGYNSCPTLVSNILSLDTLFSNMNDSAVTIDSFIGELGGIGGQDYTESSLSLITLALVMTYGGKYPLKDEAYSSSSPSYTSSSSFSFTADLYTSLHNSRSPLLSPSYNFVILLLYIGVVLLFNALRYLSLALLPLFRLFITYLFYFPICILIVLPSVHYIFSN